ncbi:MAG: TorF family putative porin [Sphingomonadaceae bacterium]|nr:TorF family putative porin [Sphingomonadaceae bacterium]
MSRSVKLLLGRVGLLGAALALPAAAHAADLSANVGLVSDYRFRGISLSDRDPALQGGVDLSLDSGFYVGSWASTIADYGGADVEVDVYAGYGGEVGLLDYSVAATAYLYPGGNGVNYGELQGELGGSLGPARLALEVAYVPDQKNTASDNFYIGPKLSVGLPATPLTFNLRGGYEDGFYDDKIDWEAGVDYSIALLTVSFAVVGSSDGGATESGKLGRTGVVLGAKLGF